MAAGYASNQARYLFDLNVVPGRINYNLTADIRLAKDYVGGCPVYSTV